MEAFVGEFSERAVGKSGTSAQDNVLQSRESEQRFIKYLKKKYNLSQDQGQELHRRISKKHLEEDEIEEEAKGIADRDGNKYKGKEQERYRRKKK